MLKNVYKPRADASVNLFCPHPPPGHPLGHYFFRGCPGLLITLFLPCPVPYKHCNHSFFQCPALIYHTHISSDPGAAPGGEWGQNNLTGALAMQHSNTLVNTASSIECFPRQLSNSVWKKCSWQYSKVGVANIRLTSVLFSALLCCSVVRCCFVQH